MIFPLFQRIKYTSFYRRSRGGGGATDCISQQHLQQKFIRVFVRAISPTFMPDVVHLQKGKRRRGRKRKWGRGNKRKGKRRAMEGERRKGRKMEEKEVRGKEGGGREGERRKGVVKGNEGRGGR
jgi:hypothetical protein